MMRLARQGFGGYKRQIITLIGMGFLSGILEGIGINAIIPLFSFVSGDSAMPQDPISKFIEWIFASLDIEYRLEFLLVFIVLLFFLKAVALFFSKYISAKIQAQYIYDTRSRLYKETLKTNWPFLSKQKIGHLEKVLVTDINAGGGLLAHMSASIILATNVLIYTIIAFNISPIITVSTLALGGLMFLIYKPLIYKTKQIAQNSTNLMKDTAHHINETLIGMKTIKSEHLEKNVIQRGIYHFEKLRQIIVKLAFIENLTYTAVQPVSIVVILGIFAFSYKSPGFNFASFAVMVYAINKMFTFVQSGQSKLNQAVALYPFLQSAIKHENDTIANREKDYGTKPFSLEREIKFSDISFAYPKAKETLSKINATIKKGEITGIIGPSGSGKTTLVDILLRLIEPTGGVVRIDDIDLNDIKLSEWRENVGYVPQDVFLVNDSIANNIRLYDPSISDEDIMKASKTARVYDFANKLPDKLETIVGERGTEISGGQRQRIALARVLARNPSILILDEATSALDNESQALIQQSIESLRGSITVIIIAHRPSTVANADQLLVLCDGSIAEQGSPRELMKDKNSYYHTILNID